MQSKTDKGHAVHAQLRLVWIPGKGLVGAQNPHYSLHRDIFG